MQAKCPICRKPTNSETHSDFPFCSERCRLIDLGKWASEEYVISEPLAGEPAAEPPQTRSTAKERNRSDGKAQK
jgi:endogenous inhibitor of DNA gyrase (YacG/DUF329 family)